MEFCPQKLNNRQTFLPNINLIKYLMAFILTIYYSDQRSVTAILNPKDIFEFYIPEQNLIPKNNSIILIYY